MFDVVVVGSVNLDLVAGTTRLPAPGETVLGDRYDEHAGGKGLNQAVAAARFGARVALLGRVGDDEPGRRLRTLAADEHVDVEHLVHTDAAPTGRALITVAADGSNSIVVVPGANAQVTAGPLPPCRVVAAQLEIPLDAVVDAFERGRAADARTVLNPAPATPLPDHLLQLTDVIVPNEHEVDLVGGVDGLLARGVGAVVVTRGAAGVTVAAAGEVTHVPTPAVTAIDSTGAGDAFCGVLAAGLAAGEPLAAAVAVAAAAGAHAVTVAGAVPSLPTADQVRALLGSPPDRRA